MLALRGWTWPGLVAALIGGALLIALALPDEGRGATETTIDSFTVSAATGAPETVSSATIEAGQTYKVIVGGTFLVEYAHSNFSHDAIYCFGSTGGSPTCNPPEQFGEKLFVGYVGGSLNGFPAGLDGASTPAYSSSHSYAVTFTATKTAKLRFFVSNPDGKTATGSLSVEIRKVSGSGQPTACASQFGGDFIDVCININPYLIKVRRPRVSTSRDKWNKAKVTFNLAPGDRADATSPPISPNQKKVVVDVKGLGNEGVAVVVDTKFRNYARVHCVGVAEEHGKTLLTQLEKGGYPSGVPALDMKLVQMSVLDKLQMCLELIDRMIERQAKAGAGPAQARAAARKCSLLREPIKISAPSGGKRRVTPLRTKEPTNLKVTCKKIKGGQRLTIRPKSRKRKLRSILGKKLHVGLMRSSIAKRSSDIGVRFKR